MPDSTEVLTADRPEPPTLRTPPAGAPTGVQRLLADALAEVAQLDRVPVDSHFFADLGADSMVMARFCARLRNRPDLPSASMKDIYQHPTIARLATALTVAEPVAAGPSALARKLGEVLAEVAQLERVPADGHFFDDLGADSMVMARFCARLRNRPDLPSVSMKDIYQHPTISSLAAAVATIAPAPVEPPAPAAVETPPNPAGTAQYVRCGALQLLIFLGYSYLIALALTRGVEWISAGAGLADVYLRAVLVGGAAFAGTCTLPILAKWVLVGRWKPGRIPLWSLAYLRFWLVKTLIRTNPLVLFVGSPLYLLYLRALGARIGPGAAVFSRTVPVCTDLLTIGAGTVIRKDSSFTGYRAHAGTIRTGPVTLGEQVLVGEATVLDIETSMGDGSQLGHASALYAGQAVPRGERWHGSPALRTDVDHRAVAGTRCGALRKSVYTAVQLLIVLGLYLPLLFGGVTILLLEVPQLAALWSPGPLAFTSWTFYRDAMAAASALFFGGLLLRLLWVLAVPRLLNRAIEPGTVYCLYGFRYWAHRVIARTTNVRLFTYLFGDSSFIVGYLRCLGYDLSRVVQTGSNFGLDVRHDNPYLSSVGTGTMVADGLSIINADYSSTSFRVSRASIGPRNFLGNYIVYPPQGRTGDNCLLATKVQVPLDGHVRQGVGLLGSPSFEIPRSVHRDGRFDQLGQGAELRRRLAAKTAHNAVTIGLFLLVRWVYFTVLVLLALGAVDLYHSFGAAAVALAGVLAVPLSVVYFALVERVTTAFRALRPQYCSIYEPYFWWHERYWKLSMQPALLNGTPFKGLIWRLLGVRLGRRLFDDGCTIMDKTLVRIGDDCTLNAGSIVQCHSQEDGAFKSDRIRIGSGCTLGIGALVHYGVTVGDGATLAPDSFLMKGEEVPAGARWGGNPARPLAGDRPRRPLEPATRTPDLQLVEPKSGARRTLSAWRRPSVITMRVLTTLAAVVWAPQVLPEMWAGLLGRLAATTAAWRGGDSAGAAAAAGQAFLLVSPVLGLTLLAIVFGSRLGRTGPGESITETWGTGPEPAATVARTRTVPAMERPASTARVLRASTTTPAVVAPLAITPTVVTRSAAPAVSARTNWPATATLTAAPALPRPAAPTTAPPVPRPMATPGRVEATPEPAVAAATTTLVAVAPVTSPGPDRTGSATAGPARAARPGLRTFVAAAAPVLLLAPLAGAGLDRRVATADEATLAAGAALLPASDLAPLNWPDTIAAPQIAAVDILLAAPELQSVVDSARAALLLAGVLGCLLLWTVARRLMLSGPAAASAVALCGVPALTSGLFGSIDAGALAALWLTVAAALAGRNRAATVTAVGAAAIAALTAPLAAVGPLVLVAHGLLTGVFEVGKRRTASRALGVALIAAAGFVAMRVTGRWPTSAGAWVGSGPGAAPVELLAGVLTAGVAVVALAWWWTPSLRPVVSAGAALLACAAVPGPHATTALLLTLPVLAVLAGALLDELPARARSARTAVLAAVLVAGAAGAWPMVATAAAPNLDRTGLTTWVRAQLDPATVLQVDPLTGAQLIRDGIPAPRLVPAAAPAAPGVLSVVAVRPGGPPAGPAGDARVLVTVPDGPGGAPTSVRQPDPGTDRTAEGRLLQSRLADNPALTLTPAAAGALRAGQVDLRLATTISGLTAAHRLTITDFVAVPGEPADASRRTALITDVDGASAAVPGGTDLVQRWLASQLPAYRPASTAIERGVLVVRHHAPSPLGPPSP